MNIPDSLDEMFDRTFSLREPNVWELLWENYRRMDENLSAIENKLGIITTPFWEVQMNRDSWEAGKREKFSALYDPLYTINLRLKRILSVMECYR